MSGKWVTFVPTQHLCEPPGIITDRGVASEGSVWECECGRRMVRTKRGWKWAARGDGEQE